MRLIEHAAARTAYLVLLLTVLLAGDAWRYTIGWVGWGILLGLLGVIAIVVLVVRRDSWRLVNLPLPLLAFLVLAALSTAWSFYPVPTVIGAATTWLTATGALAVAISYSWREILRGLGMALRILLGLSLAFELFVSLVIRHPLLPLIAQPGVDYDHLPAKIPQMLFWSRDQLFDVLHGGKIQGVFGNSVLLGFAALLAIIVFSLQLADRTVRRSWGIIWLAVAVACLAFSRSATTIVGLVVVIAVAAALLLLRRAGTPRATRITVTSILVVLVGGIAAALLARGPILALLGKSDDLTNRTQIWDAVIALAQQRPVQGWGWVSYWVPGVAPFDGLASNNGVQQLHAHNAWLDVWFQLGIIGLIVFGALVLSTVWRSWSLAVDRPQFGPDDVRPRTATALLPILLLTALLVQSLAESRLLVESGMFLLVLLAVKTRADPVPAET